MTRLLVFREHLLKFYQDYTRVLLPVFRFMVSFITFFSINQMVGYNPALNHWYVVVLLSLPGTVLPASVLLFLAAACMVLHIYYVSIILSMVLAIIFAILYFVYLRFAPGHGYVILAVPVLYALHIPYALPIILGLAAAPIAIVPMSCGIVLHYTMQSMTAVIGTATEDSIALYNQAVQMVLSNREMYLTMGIFIVITIIVYIVRSREFDYAFDGAVLAGAFVNVMLFLLINFPFDIHIHVGYLLLETVISAVLAWVFQFFRLALNYAAVEYLQFEDDEYYYYVKAVPKVSIATPKKKVKRFNAHLFADGYFGIHQEAGGEEDVQADGPEEGQEAKEDSMDQMMEKHDFDFKVSVEDEDFNEEEKS